MNDKNIIHYKDMIDYSILIDQTIRNNCRLDSRYNNTTQYLAPEWISYSLKHELH